MMNAKGQATICDCIVIFGASGDLSFRKLLPSFYDLYGLEQLLENFLILGIGRTEYSDESFRQSLVESIKEHSRLKHECINEFLEHVHYLSLAMFGLTVVESKRACFR